MVLKWLSSMYLEIIVAIVHLMFIGTGWLLGHLMYLILVGCEESGCYGDPIGMTSVFISNVVFMYITRRILDFMYKGELPGGDELVNKFNKAINGRTVARKKSKKK